MTNTFTIRSPCHPDYHLEVELSTGGRPYMTYEYADGFYCDAPDCLNAWDSDGNPI